MSNPTTTVRPAGIKCGKCKRYHVSVAAVRECFQGQEVFSIEANGATTRPDAPLANTGPLATAKQKDYLRTLCAERHTTLEFETNPRTLTMSAASQLIDEMLKTPKAAKVAKTIVEEKLPEVPAGRYAIVVDGETKFYRVDRPTEGRWAGRTFVKVQAGGEFYPVRGAGATDILKAISEAPELASKRYGHEIGACGVCGRTLTDETSRSNGIGPICAGKMGW